MLTFECFGAGVFLDLPIVISTPFVNDTATHSIVANDVPIVKCAKETYTDHFCL